MVIGALTLTLTLFESATLKDKRAVVRRAKDRVGNKFDVAVAEVDALDDPGRAVLGIVALSNEEPQTHRVLMKVLDFVEGLAIDAEISEVETEFVRL